MQWSATNFVFPQLPLAICAVYDQSMALSPLPGSLIKSLTALPRSSEQWWEAAAQLPTKLSVWRSNSNTRCFTRMKDVPGGQKPLFNGNWPFSDDRTQSDMPCTIWATCRSLRPQLQNAFPRPRKCPKVRPRNGCLMLWCVVIVICCFMLWFVV